MGITAVVTMTMPNLRDGSGASAQKAITIRNKQASLWGNFLKRELSEGKRVGAEIDAPTLSFCPLRVSENEGSRQFGE